jgi:phosphoribosylformylglycinamidine synthase
MTPSPIRPISARGLALVPQFHGTNCDQETLSWLSDNLEVEAAFLDETTHGSLTASEVACVVVPGGFSYGDYLRAGAIAARGAKMKVVARLAREGVPTLGICNGFQILCEAGLLPGVLLRNENRQHNHFPVELETDFSSLEGIEAHEWPAWLPRLSGPYASAFREHYARFALPMSCGMGRYWPAADVREGKAPESSVRPLFRYVHNENGAWNAVAAMTSASGKIVGIMPHPERASDPLLGGTQGLFFLLGLAENAGLPVRKGSALEEFSRGDLASTSTRSPQSPHVSGTEGNSRQ